MTEHPADPPSPLTAEAEKQVRAMAADTYDLTGLSDPMYATTALLLGALRKTLASLDAARAEVKRLAEIHNLTLNAMDAARAPDAGLRALRDEYANLSLPLGGTREAAKHERDTALYYIDRILASSPAPAGLDVERLADWMMDHLPEYHRWMTTGWRNTMRDEAVVLARDMIRAATRPAEDAGERP